MDRTIKSLEEKYLVPALECLMVKALIPGGLDDIHGQVAYADYECLR